MNIDVLYVVYEEDRGNGISVIGVYSSKVKAKKKAAQSSRYHIDESYSNVIDEE